MKPFRFVPDNTNISFMKLARPGFYVSIAAVLLSVVLFFSVGLKYGIDFKGGTQIQIRTMDGPADIDGLRKTIAGLGLGSSELQEFGRPDDVSIRIETQPGGEDAQQTAINTVKKALGDKVDYRAVDIVGPKVSGELARDGVLAILLSFAAIMVYIWLRFEWQFAIGTVATLVHDVALTIGLFAILQLQFDLTIIAALLTIVGYSLNDTRGCLRPVSREPAQVQEDGLRRDDRHVSQPDTAAHPDDINLHPRGADRICMYSAVKCCAGSRSP